MHITFLGTAGNLGVITKSDNTSGGIIIDHEEVQLHIDPGVGALINARKENINLRENTAILISSSHINRCNELNAVISAMTHDGLDPKGVLIINANNSVLLEKYKNCVEKVLTAEPGNTIGIEDITITPLKTSHQNRVGYRIETEKIIITYTGDTNYAPEIIDQYLRSHVLILNVPNSFTNNGEGLNSGDAVKILKQIKPDLAIITHFDKSIIQNQPLYEAREIQRQSGVSVLAAKEGLRIDPMAYLGESKQKVIQFITKKATEQNTQQNNQN